MRGDMSVNNDNLRQSERSDLRSNAHNGYLNKPHESELIIGEEVTIEGFSKLFCLMNKLYLNTCNYCQKCDSAIGDTILLKGMVSEISK